MNNFEQLIGNHSGASEDLRSDDHRSEYRFRQRQDNTPENGSSQYIEAPRQLSYLSQAQSQRHEFENARSFLDYGSYQIHGQCQQHGLELSLPFSAQSPCDHSYNTIDSMSTSFVEFPTSNDIDISQANAAAEEPTGCSSSGSRIMESPPVPTVSYSPIAPQYAPGQWNNSFLPLVLPDSGFRAPMTPSDVMLDADSRLTEHSDSEDEYSTLPSPAAHSQSFLSPQSIRSSFLRTPSTDSFDFAPTASASRPFDSRSQHRIARRDATQLVSHDTIQHSPVQYNRTAQYLNDTRTNERRPSVTVKAESPLSSQASHQFDAPPLYGYGQNTGPPPRYPLQASRSTRSSESSESACAAAGFHKTSDGFWVCQRCPEPHKYSFKHASKARKHAQTHDRPFVCDHHECTLKTGFGTKKELKRHQTEVHDKSAKYVCPHSDCKRGRGFSRVSNMKRHLENVHGIFMDNFAVRSSA